jgi:hypothetical protein
MKCKACPNTFQDYKRKIVLETKEIIWVHEDLCPECRASLKYVVDDASSLGIDLGDNDGEETSV